MKTNYLPFKIKTMDADVLAVFIPIIAILSTVALPVIVGSILIFNKINSTHKERMGLIQQGIIPPETPRRKPKEQNTPNRYASLRNGIILVTLGIGFIVGFLGIKYLVIGEDNPFFFFAASILLFLGIGFLVFFLITRNVKEYNSFDTNSDFEEDAE
jgi:hypothetical protein